MLGDQPVLIPGDKLSLESVVGGSRFLSSTEAILHFLDVPRLFGPGEHLPYSRRGYGARGRMSLTSFVQMYLLGLRR
jgi:hypothetical protein